jgi:predicted TPR repeat methyltransferase
VLHIIPNLESILAEAARVLRDSGMFAFNTKAQASTPDESKHERQIVWAVPNSLLVGKLRLTE